MRRHLTLGLAAVALSLACGTDDPTSPPPPTGDTFTLSATQVSAMSDRAEQVEQSNPSNTSFKSFVDSTLLALQAGVTMKRLDVTTNLTTAPLYFIGIHRVINQSNGGSFSTWTLIGFEDPAAFANVVQVSGFAQSSTSTAPTSVSGNIGTGAINGQLLQVLANGSNAAIAVWNYSTGNASFTSDAPSGSCPNGSPQPKLTCTTETMHVTFNIQAAQSQGSSITRSASVPVEVTVPALRLTYTP
jgi:hypothetical protein